MSMMPLPAAMATSPSSVALERTDDPLSVPAPEDGLRRAYVYRLMPNRVQAAELERTREACRLLYNLAIDQRRRALALRPCSGRGWLSWYDQKRELKDLRPASAADGGVMNLLAVPSWTCQDVLQRVDRAFARWAKPDASGKRFGYPHYQKRQDYRSWTYHALTGGWSLRAGAPGDAVGARQGPRLRLMRIGDLRVVWHRPLPEGAIIKTVSIVREADGWYVAFSLAGVPRQTLPPNGQTVALDVRIASFATRDDGTEIGNPRLYEQALRDLRLAQRRLDRRKPKPGQPASKGYEEARELLAKQHLRVRRARALLHHRVARELVNGYDTLYHEDLPVKTLLELREEETPPPVRRARNRGMADAGWGNFFDVLAAKAQETGRQVTAVNPAYTTRACSVCGAVKPEAVRSKVYVCATCGNQMKTAHNAARNVLAAGRAAEEAEETHGATSGQDH